MMEMNPEAKRRTTKMRMIILRAGRAPKPGGGHCGAGAAVITAGVSPSHVLRTASLVLAFFALTLSLRAQTYQGRQLVDAKLVANTNSVAPGKPFKVGLLLRMVPGWHTYWKFPGDAGIPT